jgi:hypothetical protein
MEKKIKNKKKRSVMMKLVSTRRLKARNDIYFVLWSKRLIHMTRTNVDFEDN